MKCDKCFFCTHIGKGIYGNYPVKYCKRTGKYFAPFVEIYEDGEYVEKLLDLDDMKDLKIWRSTGCDIHPNTVKKAKNDFLKGLSGERR